MIKISLLLAAASVFTAFIGCGGDGGQSEEISGTELTEFFPQTFMDTGIERISDVQVYEGQSLYEYIDGGAELYHLYNFERVATANYKMGEHEVVMDIYQFDTPANAYGLYSRVRPPGEEPVALGMEGFTGVGSLDFVKGQYVLRFTGYDQSDETGTMIDTMAQRIKTVVPGTVSKPGEFGVFPFQNMIRGTDVIHADSYLGHSFLSDVYERQYAFGSDTLTLFYTEDSTGGTYLLWAREVEGTREDVYLSDLPFDFNKSFLVQDDFHGNILVGLKEGKLLGVLNYGRRYMNFVSDWLEALSSEPEE